MTLPDLNLLTCFMSNSKVLPYLSLPNTKSCTQSGRVLDGRAHWTRSGTAALPDIESSHSPHSALKVLLNWSISRSRFYLTRDRCAVDLIGNACSCCSPWRAGWLHLGKGQSIPYPSRFAQHIPLTTWVAQLQHEHSLAPLLRRYHRRATCNRVR